MHNMLLSSAIHFLWLAAQNVAVQQLLLIRGHWAVPAGRKRVFSIYISVCVLKHISPVLTPKYILSGYTKDRSPKRASPMVYWGRDSCKFRFPSNRSAPKLRADGVHFHRNDQHYNQKNISHDLLLKGWWLKSNEPQMWINLYQNIWTAMGHEDDRLSLRSVTSPLPKKSCNIWVFPKIRVPQIIHFKRVFHYKPSILGVALF